MIKLELKRKKYLKLKKKAVWYFSGLILLFFTLVFLSRLDKLNIQNVEISGDDAADSEKIREIVYRELNSKYFFLFPKRNFLIYPQRGVEKALKQEFKIVKDVSFGLESRVLSVQVTDRSPAYLWCSSEGACYFLDEEGFIFDAAPSFSSGVYFKFFGQVDYPENPLGFYFAGEYFDKFISFKEKIEELELEPTSLYLKNKEVEITLNSQKPGPEGPKIFLKADADLIKAAENLQSALATEPLASEVKNRYSQLEYIDLRFGNRVYYKFRP